MAKLVALVILALIQFIPICTGSEPRIDPDTGLVRVIFMGDAFMQPGFVTPMLSNDPLIRLNPISVETLARGAISPEFTVNPETHGVDTSLMQVAARLRMYVPRTKKQLTSEYDVVIIADAQKHFFPINLQTWIKEGVIDTGQGFLMAGGPQSFGGGGEAYNYPNWDPSPIADILPCSCPSETWGLTKSFHLVATADHSLVNNIPWEKIWLVAWNRVTEKDGCVVLGRSDRNPPGSPILSYIEMGEGRAVAFVYDWGGNGVEDFHRWDYAPVVVSNLVYHAARMSIPEDLGFYVRLRNRIGNYHQLRRYVISVLGFAEKFGANLRETEKALIEAREKYKEVITLYVNGDSVSCMDALDEAFAQMKIVSELALSAKDEALMWVFIIEWFTVTGTALVSGGVIWTLMVRKAVYKEVATTRLVSSED